MQNFESFIADLRQESEEILSIANNGSSKYKTLKEVPTPVLENAANTYRKAKYDKL